MDLILLSVALLGHAVLWIGLVNRVHATSLPRRLVGKITWLSLAAIVLIPVGFSFSLVRLGFRPMGPTASFSLPKSALAYLVICWVLAVLVLERWAWKRLTHRPVDVLWSHRRQPMKTKLAEGNRAVSEDHMHHLLAHLPGNQILQIDVAERVLAMPRLDASLDGLSIVHLSDLHFTGRVGKAFFQEVVQLSNELEPDLVALTGDLVDTDECIDWVPDVLGPLVARHGVYFVLGNHDLRVDTNRLRRMLGDAGLIDLGGRWVERPINGSSVVLAGNELPWFPPAADMRDAPARGADGGPLRVLLSHSPDQLDWAVALDFDLMLAGHLHGGQFRLPLIGPILAPSRQGVRYASGIFHHEPTILHVSRGLSGEVPIRLNCPPELTELILRSADD
ncbi:MAG: metallophosphoesterase [Pirellulales bacterium]|nr:metallophosphoesterase [Pirellulales bacterium]